MHTVQTKHRFFYVIKTRRIHFTIVWHRGKQKEKKTETKQTKKTKNKQKFVFFFCFRTKYLPTSIFYFNRKSYIENSFNVRLGGWKFFIFTFFFTTVGCLCNAVIDATLKLVCACLCFWCILTKRGFVLRVLYFISFMKHYRESRIKTVWIF